MMIGLGTVQAAHCGMITLFLGVVPHETPIEQVRNHAAWREVFGRASVDTNGSDPAIRQWACFLNALAMAAVLDVGLGIDG